MVLAGPLALDRVWSDRDFRMTSPLGSWPAQHEPVRNLGLCTLDVGRIQHLASPVISGREPGSQLRQVYSLSVSLQGGYELDGSYQCDL